MKKILLVLFLIISLLEAHYACADKLSSYPLTSILSNGDLIVVIHSNANANINWSNFKAILTTGINWQAIPSVVNNVNINWQSNLIAGQNLNGVNWQALTTSSGINWFTMANGVTPSTLVCWKSNGQPGKCTTGVSGVSCTSCN